MAIKDTQSELDAWLDQNWDPSLSLIEWRRRLLAGRWAVPSWPAEWYGRGLPLWSEEMVAATLRSRGAPGLPVGVGTGLAAPTILAHGPDAVRARFLPTTLTGEETWCQLFSEPGAGSDLAGLTTHAVRDGDRWVVNGQKVWNTSAQRADLGILMARTNWDVPKHRGITFFVLPMRQPGVQVRPLRQMNFHSSFNEVFLSDATVPADWVVGDVDQGWGVGLTTLGYERRFAGAGRPWVPDGSGPAASEARAEAAEHFKTYEWYPQRAGRPDLVASHAQSAGRSADGLVRQSVTSVHAMRQVSAWTAERARAARALGRPPGPEGSIGKLAMSNLAREAATAHALIAGSGALVSGPESPLGGVVAETLISVPAQSIAGGTDEIQRNIVAERVLGLPREPNPDGDRPYREIRRNG